MVHYKERYQVTSLKNLLLEELVPVRSIYAEHIEEFEDFIVHNPLTRTAFQIAFIAHEGQNRDHQSRAYINHPYETAFLARYYLSNPISAEFITERDIQHVVATALLHDVIEMNPNYDAKKLQFRLEIAKIELSDAKKIAYYVQRLTPKPKPADETIHQMTIRKIAEAGRLLCSDDPIVNIVKAADILANAKETLREVQTADPRINLDRVIYPLEDRIFVFKGRSEILTRKAKTELLLVPFAKDMQETVTVLEDLTN